MKISILTLRDAVSVAGHSSTVPYYSAADGRVEMELLTSPPAIRISAKGIGPRGLPFKPKYVPMSNVVSYEFADEAPAAPKANPALSAEGVEAGSDSSRAAVDDAPPAEAAAKSCSKCGKSLNANNRKGVCSGGCK